MSDGEDSTLYVTDTSKPEPVDDRREKMKAALSKHLKARGLEEAFEDYERFKGDVTTVVLVALLPDVR